MTFFITGATGHLGYHLVRKLVSLGHDVYALVLPHDPLRTYLPTKVKVVEGSLVDQASVDAFLNQPSQGKKVCIHAASRVSTENKTDVFMYQINVVGTQHILNAVKQFGIDHLIYVSSVHALKTLPDQQVMNETHLAQPEEVVGEYAKTKTKATQLVWEAHLQENLPITIVYPSGFIGPNDYGKGYTSLMVKEAMQGRMNIYFRGGYDFVDVRDVADGIISIAEKALIGKTYLLNHTFISFASLMKSIDIASGHRPFRFFIPRWMICMAIPFVGIYYRLAKKKPLLNQYAWMTMGVNARFDHTLATQDFGYQPRPLLSTMRDVVNELREMEMDEIRNLFIL